MLVTIGLDAHTTNILGLVDGMCPAQLEGHAAGRPIRRDARKVGTDGARSLPGGHQQGGDVGRGDAGDAASLADGEGAEARQLLARLVAQAPQGGVVQVGA